MLLEIGESPGIHRNRLRCAVSVCIAKGIRADCLQIKQEASRQKLSNKALFERWSANVKFGTITKNDKDMTFNMAFVDAAILVHSRILVHEEARDLVLWAEHHWGKQTPWCSIYRLEAVCRKVGNSSQKMVWVLASVQDLLANDQIQATSLSVKNLSGRGMPGNRGTIDLILLKGALKDLFTGQWLRESPLDAQQQALISECLSSHSAHAQYFGSPSAASHDMSWMAQVPLQAHIYINFAEALIYTSKEDRKLKSALVSSPNAIDVPDRDEFKTDFEKIQEAWKLLKKPDVEDSIQAIGSAEDHSQAMPAGRFLGEPIVRAIKSVKGENDAELAKHMKESAISEEKNRRFDAKPQTLNFRGPTNITRPRGLGTPIRTIPRTHRSSRTSSGACQSMSSRLYMMRRSQRNGKSGH